MAQQKRTAECGDGRQRTQRRASVSPAVLSYAAEPSQTQGLRRSPLPPRPTLCLPRAPLRQHNGKAPLQGRAARRERERGTEVRRASEKTQSFPFLPLSPALLLFARLSRRRMLP